MVRRVRSEPCTCAARRPSEWCDRNYPHIAGVLAVDGAGDAGRYVGSALRLSFAGRRCIVSAAHVIEQARREGRFAVGAVRGQAPFELHGAPDRLDETLDIAAYFLPHNYPDEGLAFWSDAQADVSETTLSTDYLFMHGFPGVRAYFSPNLGGLMMRSLPYGAMLREEELPAEMASFQFALDFDPSNMVDAEGNAAEWLDPHGLSGSPVWRIGASGQKVDAWKPELSLLVGIVTSWKPDERLLLATKVAPVLSLFDQ